MNQRAINDPKAANASAHPGKSLAGRLRVPGDKSVSHRALMLGGLAIGETTVTGMLEGEDVLATAAAMRRMGADITRTDDGAETVWRIVGRGLGGLVEPDDVLDMGNAGTGCRLLMGLVAGHPIRATFTGDASLRRRPMERIMAPLRQMGARFEARDGGLLPITVNGPDTPLPIDYTLPVASAQVKSAVLLAGLSAPGETTVIEPSPSRDHTERMLAHFGAEVRVADDADGGRRVTVVGQPELRAAAIAVPGDISSAAFPLVAALIVPGSALEITGVGLNPLRAGLLDTLAEMGAAIEIRNRRDEGGEPVGDLIAVAGPLGAITVPAARAPSMIDEYPVLAVAAAFADGTTRMEGLGELRVKESDRLAAVATGLAACGVGVRAGDDWLEVDGGAGTPPAGGAAIVTDLDHRIAMAFLVLGLAAAAPVTIDDASPIATSFPGFIDMMNGLGADIRETPA